MEIKLTREEWDIVLGWYLCVQGEGLENEQDEALAEKVKTRLSEEPCPYTFAHTRNWCGNLNCREA